MHGLEITKRGQAERHRDNRRNKNAEENSNENRNTDKHRQEREACDCRNASQ